MSAPLATDTRALAGLFTASGVIHLVRSQVFEPIVPAPLREHDRALVLASGVAELACAAGLVHPATRRAAGWASVAVLLGVLPANVQMSLDHGRRAQRRQTPAARGAFAGTLLRLPLQLPMLRAAYRATRR